MSNNAQALRLRQDTLDRAAASAAAFTGTLDVAARLAGDAATSALGDYKALVCLFLYGGNDYANTLTPYDDASYAAYRAARQTIAHKREDLAATVLSGALDGGRRYALHPNLAPLLPLYEAGVLAPVLNVGTLLHPLTKAQYVAGTVPAPPKLFSHNDQQNFFQAGAPEGARDGAGGRIGDAVMDTNQTKALTCINLGSNAVFLTGHSALQYTIGQNGPIPLLGNAQTLYSSKAVVHQLREMITARQANIMMDEHAKIAGRSLANAGLLADALGGVGDRADQVNNQIRMIAKLIAAAPALGQKRQVFMLGLGGFDNHDSLVRQHGGLMTLVASVMRSFYDFTAAQGIADKVTLFTASDFGRTLATNEDGSDHGWGGHHFVMGGAVRGGRIYGTPPEVGNDTDSDVGQGRLLPTTSVDQYIAPLATWLGVPAGDLATVLPSLRNFSGRPAFL